MLKLPHSALSVFETVGYVLVGYAFDPVPVQASAETAMRNVVEGAGRGAGERYYPDVLFDPVVQELMVDPDLLAFAERILGCRPAFGSLASHVIPAGGKGMEAHIDYPYFAMSRMPDMPDPTLCVQVIWYPWDVGEDWAPTSVAAGTHLQPRKPDQEEYARVAEPVLASAGDLLISHGALWHSVMPNKTDRPRPVILGSFVPFWVRPMLRPMIPHGVHPDLRTLMCEDFGERIGECYERNSVKVSE